MKQEMTYEEKAAFIFRACSAHDDLVAALVWAAKNLEEVAIPMAQRYGHVTSLDGALERARAALAKAKGEQ